LAAYSRAAELKPQVWVPTVVAPALLAASGRSDEAVRAVEQANAWSWNVDPWLALETAWRELPAPVTEDVLLGRGDYGAARGFSNPLRDGRWSRHRAWLRVCPTTAAPAYDVTLWMGSPPPSPLEAPVVRVRTADGTTASFTLRREIAPYQLQAVPDPDGVVVVRLDAPTWNRRGEPAEQGVMVQRVRVVPAR